MRKRLICLSLLAACLAARAQDALIPVASLNVPRYLGVWYEIAKIPNFFQRNCASNTVAQYSTLPDGTLRVLNTCTQEDGKAIKANGQVRQLGDATSARLAVRFAPEWMSFLPFVWGDYWVVDIDPDYQLVAVSEPKREYLWILSRQSAVNAKAYDELLVRLRAKSIDTTKLEPTRHSP